MYQLSHEHMDTNLSSHDFTGLGMRRHEMIKNMKYNKNDKK